MARMGKAGLSKGPARSRHRAAASAPLLLAASAVVAGSALWAPAQAADLVFGAPQRVIGTSQADAEPPQVAVSGNAVYLAWHEFPTSADNQPDVYFSRSTNSGGGFSPRVNLSNSAGVDSSGEQVAASGSNVAVVWVETDPMTFLPEIYLRTSTNGGVSFKPRKKVTGTGNPNTPRVSLSGARLLVAWQADGQAGNPDIYFAQSANAGTTLSLRKNISKNDGTSEFRDQGLRQTAAAGNTLIVTWRDDSIPGAAFEIFVAQGK